MTQTPSRLPPSVLILPGLGGSEPGHWQSLWEAELPNAARVEQADWRRPSLPAWRENAAAAVRRAPGAVLVGHSLGAILIAHLGASGLAAEVGGALLVAPADVEANGRRLAAFASFAPIPRAPLPFPSIVIASVNDPYARLERSHDWARAWRARFVSVGAQGHINTAAGVGAWREGRVWLETLLQGRIPRTA